MVYSWDSFKSIPWASIVAMLCTTRHWVCLDVSYVAGTSEIVLPCFYTRLQYHAGFWHGNLRYRYKLQIRDLVIFSFPIHLNLPNRWGKEWTWTFGTPGTGFCKSSVWQDDHEQQHFGESRESGGFEPLTRGWLACQYDFQNMNKHVPQGKTLSSPLHMIDSK